jgi:catechol 2,3-dioxygenase-like lactoylglutathione lyase family enzyme
MAQSIIATLRCSNMRRSLAFYTGVLDFAHVDGDDNLDDPSFSVLSRGGDQLHLSSHLGDGVLFGGEGFIMQRLQGDGWAFDHAGGTLHERTLGHGELIRVDTGCIVAFQPSVNYDIQYVGKIKSAMFGGEGLFFATLRGPGRVWLQSLPLSRLANRIIAAAPGLARGGKEEGSILGGLGGLLDGDNS